MSKYFICCEKCFETIGKRNTVAARFWMDLCAMSLNKGQPVILETKDFPELRVLETLGFVVSSDRLKTIAVRVNGHCHTDDGQPCFCLQGGEHERA